MTPIALGTGEGSQFRSPLGVAIIGGVITSTFLTLLVIPTFYEVLHDTRARFFGAKKAVTRHLDPVAAPPLTQQPTP